MAASAKCDERGQLAHRLRVDGQVHPVLVLDLPIPALDPRPALGVQRHAVGASLSAESLGGVLLVVRLSHGVGLSS